MPLRFTLLLACLLSCPLAGAAGAAEVGPPMFDITRQCDAASRHNVTAMSECVVAESEARAELLQNWARYSDAAVEKCAKGARKAARHPYGVMAKCMAPELAAGAAATPTK